MSYKNEIICPDCNKPVPASSEQTTMLCVYCGKKLTAHNMPDPNKLMPDTADNKAWETLYNRGRFIEIQHVAATVLQTDKNAVLPRTYSILARLRLLYDGYDESTRDENRDKGVSNKLYSYLLKSESPSGTFHEAFFDNVTQSAAQITQLLSEIKYVQPDLSQSAATMAIDSLLFYNADAKPQSVLTAYEMLEKHAIIFLSFLNTDNLERYYSAYRPYSRHRILGLDTLRAIKKELKSRNRD